ncbi:MAG: ABC transporter substrate-binding protein [Planctomycetota bacterium]|nr:MAG: ABC transporter substrate-binding protein [Planctomycetota bacterium]
MSLSQHSKKGLIFSIMAVFVSLLFFGMVCSVGAAEDTKPEYGGVLRIIEIPPGSPFGIPWETIGVSICSAMPALEQLVRMDRAGTAHPFLAESYEVAPDLKSITFKIRKGIKFHDGTDLNAEAVRFNLQSILDAKIGAAMQWASIETLDDYTVRLNLKSYDNRIFVSLAGTMGSVISPTYLKKNGVEAARWHPVGTGPFEFVSYERDVAAKYKKFNGYWDKPKPYLDGVEIRYMRDIQTIKASLLADEIEVFGADGGELIAELVSKGLKEVYEDNGIVMLIPDSANPESPFANKMVREALAYAIDREAIAKARGFGYWEPTNQFAFPEHSAYFEDHVGPGYDPEKAKSLLAKAGYPNGFKTKIIPMPYVVDRDAPVAVQAFLTAVGIQAEVEFPEMSRYRQYQTKGWRGLVMQPWGFFANYNRSIGFYFYGPEKFISMQRPPELAKLLKTSIATVEPEVKNLQALHRALIEHQTLIPVYRHTRNYVSKEKVHGTNHMQYYAWPYWAPAEAWMSK